MKSNKIRNDVILIGIILAVSLAFVAVAAAAQLQKNHGYAVEITVNGQHFGAYPLVGDAVIDVDGLLTVIIENGEARVAGSTCPDGFCEKHAPVSRAGETIVCLPRGVIIRVSGEGEADVVI
ncbi:MAG: NusG domain II-containing protein [Clostridia bacterium]|nr:NusG domain II-containing protein [Clostridia bacterium]